MQTSNITAAIKETEIVVDGKTILIRTGRTAKQAGGAVEVFCGETMVLVTCTESKTPRDLGYFP